MGNFFQISSSSVNFLLASISTLIGNTMPIILPVLGIIIGIWIFGRVTSVGLTKARKEYNEEAEKFLHSYRYKPDWENEPIPFHEAGDFEEDED
jgi:hypothetical protein